MELLLSSLLSHNATIYDDNVSIRGCVVEGIICFESVVEIVDNNP